MNPRVAFDATARTVDVDGRLHISKSHISKAGVNGYYGREIPRHEALGLDPNKLYQLLRSPEELARAASTFARLPILSKHIPISADDHPQELVVGTIGSDVVYNHPYIDADTCYWNNEAIAGIKTGVQREHSSAYRYVAVMTPGEYEGQAYDGMMTDLIGNHLALVEAGRAGPDVLAADSKPEIPTMKHTKWGSALLVSVGALSPKIAQDSALPALVGMSTRKTFNKVDFRAKVIAMDSTLDPVKLDIVMDGMTDEDDKPTGAADEDETEEEKEARLKKEKLAADAEKDEDKKAMDAAISKATDQVRKDMKEANEARIAVQDVVGNVIAQDSAAEIYGFALDEMKVPHEGVTELAGLKALFNAAKTPRQAPLIAQDIAPTVKMFANATRFNRA